MCKYIVRVGNSFSYVFFLQFPVTHVRWTYAHVDFLNDAKICLCLHVFLPETERSKTFYACSGR